MSSPPVTEKTKSTVCYIYQMFNMFLLYISLSLGAIQNVSHTLGISALNNLFRASYDDKNCFTYFRFCNLSVVMNNSFYCLFAIQVLSVPVFPVMFECCGAVTARTKLRHSAELRQTQHEPNSGIRRSYGTPTRTNPGANIKKPVIFLMVF